MIQATTIFQNNFVLASKFFFLLTFLAITSTTTSEDNNLRQEQSKINMELLTKSKISMLLLFGLEMEEPISLLTPNIIVLTRLDLAWIMDTQKLF